jgi:hypothetical protein
VIDDLVAHAEEAWPALIEHLDDKRYCVTFEQDQSAYNYSIAGICIVLLRGNLIEAYVHQLPALDRPAYGKLRSPDVIPDHDFKEWCRKQHDDGKKLYELQIEMCEWAIEAISELDEVSEKVRDASIASIEKQIELLRKTKRPILKKEVTDGSRWVYS